MFKRVWFERLMSHRLRAALVLPVWFVVVWNMSVWWLQSERVDYKPLFIMLSTAMLYEFILLPSAFLYFVMRAKEPKKRIAEKGSKVAVISLCVPNQESLNIIENQLKAMTEIKYPHDSWILDEGGSKEVKRLAAKHKVKYFSRKGVKKYNQNDHPFKKKTKAGNVNAWLDHVKRRKYEYFVQLDIDHLPRPDYLDKTLGYFRDDNVAWVQSPSVYRNRLSWIARGSSEQELVLQGPLQMGFYGHSGTPFIIGSHCAYRLSAIEKIDGFQPTRAEDHLDTVALASIGYKGVFLPKIIAEGDGPETLKTYLAQQFAWAYSMFQVLINYSPRLLWPMSFKRKLQFLFAQTWYPLWSLSYLVLFFTPVIALLIKKDVAHVNLEGFITHFIPLFIGAFLVWWAGRPLMQPKGLRLSWRGVLLHAIRWPVVLQAIVYAAFKVKRPYMITPKGKYAKNKPNIKVYMPFLTLGLLSSLSIILSNIIYRENASRGQIIFAMMNSLFMFTICAVDINISMRAAEEKIKKINQYWMKPIAATTFLMFIIAIAAASSSIASNKAFAFFSQAKQPQLQNLSLDKMNTGQLINVLSGINNDNSSLTTPALGIYNDPKLQKPDYIDSEHIVHLFVDWRDQQYLARQLVEIKESNNTVLITLEPRGDNNGADLLRGISKGRYDDRLDQIIKIVEAYHRTTYIRFAHEAELKNLYPWSNQDPSLYISAFRHVVNYAKTSGAQNIKWVWSPAGNPGAEAYYPGDKYVDIVGTTILYDKYWYGDSHPSFNQIAEQRLWLFSFKKPVWVVEFGVGRSDPSFQHDLIKDALANYKKLGFKALIYLNMVDANINGPDYILNDPKILNIEKTQNHTTDKTNVKDTNTAKINCDLNLSLTFIDNPLKDNLVFCKD